MIVVRDVFRVRFGQMKDAVASIQTLSSTLEQAGESFPFRVLTDVSGPFYTLVLESSFDNLASYESQMQSMFAKSEWKDWYQSFLPFITDGQREMFKIVLES